MEYEDGGAIELSSNAIEDERIRASLPVDISNTSIDPK